MIRLKKLNNERRALLICDMLNDFVREGAPLEVPAARAIVGNIKKEIQRARKKRIPIIYCCDAHNERDPEFALWPRHAVKGSEGAHIIKQLEPRAEDYEVFKSSYSCFYRTPLDKLLKKLEITQLIITGVVTNICIIYTVADAYMRGYKIVVLENCTVALTQREHRFALEQMRRVFHADII